MHLKAISQKLRERMSNWWRGPALGQLGQFVNIAAIVLSVGWFLPLFFSHLKVIAQPGPQEYNEPAIWHATHLLDHGRNPYSAKELPGSLMCFDPFYNYVVLAFKPLFGIDYSAHRMVNMIFLMGSLGLMVHWVRKAGAGLGIGLLMAVFYYWMTLGNISITARPDTLGLFFFLLGVFVPWEYHYTRWSTVFGLACAFVAFHCKFYYVLAGCATLLAHFMVRNKREACVLGFIFFAVLGLSFAVCCYFYPYFYVVTVIIQRGGAMLNSRDDVSLMHTQMLFERGWPFLVPMLCGVGIWLWRRRAARREGEVAVRSGDVPFLAMGANFLIFLALVYFIMGRNAGAYFTYHLHLLFPLMFVLSAYMLTRPWVKIGFGILLSVFVTLSMSIPGVPDSAAPYRRMEQLIFNCHSEILGIACVTDIFERDSRKVIHNGNTMFVGFAFGEGRADRDPMVGVLAKNYKAAEDDAVRKVAAREYGMVLTEFDEPYFCDAALLQKNYDKVEQIDYFTYFGHSPVRVWRPKPREPMPNPP